MRRLFLVWMVVAVASGAGACGQGGNDSRIPIETTVGGTTGTDLDAGGLDAASTFDAGSTAFPSGGFGVAGNIEDSVSSANLAGVAVCLIQAPTACATTDGSGDFTVSGVQTTGDGLIASLSGYVTGLWPLTPHANLASYAILLRSEARMATLTEQVGTTFSASNGAVDFEAVDGSGTPLAGVVVTTSGGAGVVAYFDGATLSSTLKSTQAAGTGFVFNVPPGTIAVGFAAPGKTCTSANASGWAPGPGATVNVPVQAGRITRAAAVCQ